MNVRTLILNHVLHYAINKDKFDERKNAQMFCWMNVAEFCSSTPPCVGSRVQQVHTDAAERGSQIYLLYLFALFLMLNVNGP